MAVVSNIMSSLETPASINFKCAIESITQFPIYKSNNRNTIIVLWNLLHYILFIKD